MTYLLRNAVSTWSPKTVKVAGWFSFFPFSSFSFFSQRCINHSENPPNGSTTLLKHRINTPSFQTHDPHEKKTMRTNIALFPYGMKQPHPSLWLIWAVSNNFPLDPNHWGEPFKPIITRHECGLGLSFLLYCETVKKADQTSWDRHFWSDTLLSILLKLLHSKYHTIKQDGESNSEGRTILFS